MVHGKRIIHKKNGNVIGVYSSIREISEQLGLNRKTISDVCHGYYKLRSGSEFSFINEEDDYLPDNSKRHIILTKDGMQEKFGSAAQAR